ncbi:MAG TPA: hypothetical protein VJB99_02185 [Patescibacteria group bacterium]|nr:hypothetical protein [Patescibacteria group bacterium]
MGEKLFLNQERRLERMPNHESLIGNVMTVWERYGLRRHESDPKAVAATVVRLVQKLDVAESWEFFDFDERVLFMTAVAEAWLLNDQHSERKALLDTAKLMCYLFVASTKEKKTISRYVRALAETPLPEESDPSYRALLARKTRGIPYDPRPFVMEKEGKIIQTAAVAEKDWKKAKEDYYDEESSQKLMGIVNGNGVDSPVLPVREKMGIPSEPVYNLFNSKTRKVRVTI